MLGNSWKRLGARVLKRLVMLYGHRESGYLHMKMLSKFPHDGLRLKKMSMSSPDKKAVDQAVVKLPKSS